MDAPMGIKDVFDLSYAPFAKQVFWSPIELLQLLQFFCPPAHLLHEHPELPAPSKEVFLLHGAGFLAITLQVRSLPEQS